MPVGLATLLLFIGLAPSLLAGDTFQVTTPGLPGPGGLVPSWTAVGVGTSGSLGNLFTLEDAPAGAAAILVIGPTEVASPFKGGILGPLPAIVVPGLPVAPDGTFELALDVPPGVPAGAELWSQAWIPTPAEGNPWAASNTLRVLVRALPDTGHWFPVQSYGSHYGPGTLALADVDQDGLLDVVSVHEYRDQIAVHRNLLLQTTTP